MAVNSVDDQLLPIAILMCDARVARSVAAMLHVWMLVHSFADFSRGKRQPWRPMAARRAWLLSQLSRTRARAATSSRTMMRCGVSTVFND